MISVGLLLDNTGTNLPNTFPNLPLQFSGLCVVHLYDLYVQRVRTGDNTGTGNFRLA